MPPGLGWPLRALPVRALRVCRRQSQARDLNTSIRGIRAPGSSVSVVPYSEERSGERRFSLGGEYETPPSIPVRPHLVVPQSISYCPPVSNTNEIGLGEMIAELRTELGGALLSPTQTGLRFEPTEIELELHVQVTRKSSAEGSGKFSFKVLDFVSLEAGGGGSLARETARSHTFKLKLRPEVLDASGKSRKAWVNDEKTGEGGGDPVMPGRR